jgi:tetratricopeptide (TPR) repeat protein
MLWGACLPLHAQKRKKLYCFFLLLTLSLTGNTAFAQDYSKETKALLDSVVAEYKRTNFQEGLEYANQAIEVAHKIPKAQRLSTDSLIERARAYKANIFLQLSQSDSCLRTTLLMEKTGFATSLFAYRTYLFMMAAATNLSSLDTLRYAYNKGQEALKALEGVESAEYVLNQRGNLARILGNSYYGIDEYDSALHYYKHSVELFTKSGHAEELLKTQHTLGIILVQAERFALAEEYLNTVIKNAPKEGPYSIFSFKAKSSLITAYINQNKKDPTLFKEAKQAFQAEIEKRQDNMDIFVKYEYSHTLANYALILELPEEAMKYHNIARKAAAKTPRYEKLQINLNTQLGQILQRIGKKEEARAAYQKALVAIDKFNTGGHKRITLQRIAELEEELGNYKQALEHYKAFKVMEDSMAQKKMTNLIAEHEVAFNTEKKEQENSLLKAQNKAKEAEIQAKTNQNLVLFIGIIALVIIVGLIFQAQRRQKKTNGLLRQKNNEIKSKSEELQQINEALHSLSNFKESMTGMLAHDIKNPLNTILHFGTQNEVQRAGWHILRLIKNLLEVQKFEEADMPVHVKPLAVVQVFAQAKESVLGILRQKALHLSSQQF